MNEPSSSSEVPKAPEVIAPIELIFQPPLDTNPSPLSQPKTDKKWLWIGVSLFAFILAAVVVYWFLHLAGLNK
jgi:hypothetical protein